MQWSPIVKTERDWKVPPNLQDYAQTRAAFSWEQARGELDGLPHQGGLNIAYEAVDRHAAGPRADHIAWRWLGKSGEVRDFTYAQVKAETNRFANVLASLGVEQGDRIFVLAGRIPELDIAALGTLKRRGVF